MPESKKKKGKARYWLSLTGIAAQMGVIIYLGAWFGQWLDAKNESESNTNTVFFTLVAVAVAMYLVVKQTKKLNS
ncbi:MAG: AtpZ/AtpI family protein [Eudoraea sp.]|nr:AtpZ/AtpI family protein [Eudoraea sp.]NNJ38969.1 AtpZ/AtpI family protein [Flavobacteriaceae bacterium]MBT8206295.1 AtpZ/AtpI family protein [Eudoraea sp.]MBT8210089.1 AtpZ/AtpI family protein [Eudoraea sp.]MBT8312555.1 AtpZ/AtpI family protein [Eudoraea sp.]